MKAFIVLAAIVVAAYAEAEADPALLYAGVGYPYALPYAVGKSAPCVNAANVPVPCAHGYAAYPYATHLIGKREAESEPEADPALLYAGLGYHGYAYPYAAAYGAYPYAGLVHSSNLGICTNYLGARVPC